METEVVRMDYIVMDLEWNQPWPGSPSAKKIPMRGEIIQIGAVRLTIDGSLTGEFQILIRPQYFRRLNRQVSKLTGLKESQLRQNGIPFPEAMAQFRAWCGESVTLLTWGFDDIGILQENLNIHHLDTNWTDPWYNAQVIFNAQTDQSHTQKALKTAMDLFGIEASRPAHDALGDAYHTAQICAKLDLQRGIQEYPKKPHKTVEPSCVCQKMCNSYANVRTALQAMSDVEHICPICGKPLSKSRWLPQHGRRYLSVATCPEHGAFLIRLRVIGQPDGTQSVRRTTYEATTEAQEAYVRRVSQIRSVGQGSAQTVRARRHRRAKSQE